MNAMDDSRWRAVLERDHRADGKFYYSVRTTGVYSKPSCVARPARRENVVFFSTAAEAEAAGYRACQRCHPDQQDPRQHVAAVVRACRITDRCDEDAPSLDDLAAAVGFSRFHFHRIFKAVAGTTPHRYMSARRAERLREALTNGGSVTDAIYDAGFSSNGHFYATSPQVLGMTPTRFRSGGDGTVVCYHIGEYPAGPVLVAVADRGVCDVLLDDGPDTLVSSLRAHFPHARLVPAGPGIAGPVEDALAAVEPPPAAAELPWDIRATILREQIRNALPELNLAKAAG